MGLTLLYDLTWRDVMYVLGQMLTPDSRTRVLGEATILLLKMNDLSMRQGERGNTK